jgi:hypothetical protein
MVKLMSNVLKPLPLRAGCAERIHFACEKTRGIRAKIKHLRVYKLV